MDCQPLTHPKPRAFSLVEAAMVLAIVGFVLGGIWYSAASFYESYKVNKTVEGIFTIARNVTERVSFRDAGLMGNGYSMDNFLVNSKAVPEDWVQPNGLIKNPFGGSVGMANYIGPPRFAFVLSGIPKSACAKLITGISSKLGNGNSLLYSKDILYRISLNADGHLTLDTMTFPISIDTASSSCGTNNIIQVMGHYNTRNN